MTTWNKFCTDLGERLEKREEQYGLLNKEKLDKALKRYKASSHGSMTETFWMDEIYKLVLPQKTYVGEQGIENMKADLREIIHACGGRYKFMQLIYEIFGELLEEAWEREQEGRMNGV